MFQKYMGQFSSLFSLKVKTKSIKSYTSSNVLMNLFSKNAPIKIFDVGAHKGQSARKFKKLFKHSEIYSFEPFPSTFDKLNLLKLDKFKAFNFGFSDRHEFREFRVNQGSQTNSMLRLSRNAKAVWGGNEALSEVDQIKCEFKKIDDFCKANYIDCLDFLKIDVQGAEFKVLKGAHELLAAKKIKVIQFEVIIGETYDGQKPISYYFQLLENYDYKLKMICDLVQVDGDLVQADLFFTSD